MYLRCVVAVSVLGEGDGWGRGWGWQATDIFFNAGRTSTLQQSHTEFTDQSINLSLHTCTTCIHVLGHTVNIEITQYVMLPGKFCNLILVHAL